MTSSTAQRDGVIFYYRNIDTSPLSPGRRHCHICDRRLKRGSEMVAVSVGALNEPPPPNDRFSLICSRCRGTPQEMTDRIYRRLFGEPAPVGREVRQTRQ
jgi:hypothetical protein